MQRNLGALSREKTALHRGMIVPGAGVHVSSRTLDSRPCINPARVLQIHFLGSGNWPGESARVEPAHSGIRDAVRLPLIFDAHTGFGNAINLCHTIRTLESDGANAIQLEDQVMPKRSGHDIHDTYLAADYAHPGDTIPSILVVGQAMDYTGAQLLRGIAESVRCSCGGDFE